MELRQNVLCQQGYLFQAMVKIKAISLMKRITNRTVDLHRIEMINGFSRKIKNERISIEEAEKTTQNKGIFTAKVYLC